MHKVLPAIFLCVLCLMACAKVVPHAPASDTVVSTKYGLVQGFKEQGSKAQGYKAWLGIPYGAAPVGALRFRRHQPPKPWSGIKECVAFGPKPVQFMTMLGLERTAVPSSEDCLSLNIWAPANAKAGDNLPVFVWIYGGAFHMGEGSDPLYDGAPFAQSGAIFVSFNYRVGPLGFYDFSMYDTRFESNCAVSDQIGALRFVKENIAAFGGDANNITIAGESAGGTGVYTMLAAPSTNGLFHKAIAQSGVPGITASRRATMLNNGLFFDKLNLDPRNTAHMDKLHTMSAKEMLPAAKHVLEQGQRTYPGLFMPGPVLDDILPMQPWEALGKGLKPHVSLIAGTNGDEGTMFTLMGLLPPHWEDTKRLLENNNALQHLGAIEELYKGKKEKAKVEALAADTAFVVDMLRIADAQSRFAPTYLYRFDYVPLLSTLLGLGAAHSSDITPTLGTHEHPLWLLTSSQCRHDLTLAMQGSWLRFMKNGDPNGEDLSPQWPKYNAVTRQTYIFDTQNRVEDNPSGKVYEVLKDIQLYK